MEESLILKNLNDEQRAPASVIDGPVLVTAGAGSGKTRMLTHRIAHMVSDCAISPYNILAITFTNKSANEMKARLERMIDNCSGMWICTFHAMCSRILREHGELLGYTKSFSIYGDTEKNRLIKRLIGGDNNENSLSADSFEWHISNAKNNLLSPEKYANFVGDQRKRQQIFEVYSKYEEHMKKANALDFDDLLFKTYQLFKMFPDVLELYQRRFLYIFIDEFQDTNIAQYELVKLLAGSHQNVCAVGDEDQCIYSWRGAQVSNVKQFTKDFAGCKIFKLEQNYRSTKKILGLANKLIKHNSVRIEKNLWTENEDGAEVELKQTYNDIEEAEFVAEKIAYAVKNGDARYNDFAVLMRVNSLSRVLEEKLLTYNIPYRLYGGFKFFERKEIKDTLAYLYLVSNPSDSEATNRMLTFPKKGIGDVSIAQITKLAADNDKSMFEIITHAEDYGISGALLTKLNSIRNLFDDLNRQKENMPLDEFVQYLVKTVAIKEAIGNKTEEDENKCLNIDDLIKSVAEFADANEGASVDEFLQSITLMRDIDSLDEEENFVSLITIHSAKGLEFENVFVVELNDGLFPLSRAINSADPNELEEERRLMYVAITRAKKRLILTRPKVKFNFESKRSEYTQPSRFLSEIFDDFTKSGAVRSSLAESGFDKFMSAESDHRSLDERMSSHVFMVDVSKPSSTGGAASGRPQLSASDFAKFKKGTRVHHEHFGDGVVTLGVTDFASAFVTIKFDSVGIKTLSLKYAKLTILE